jgi:hypothetical protein
MTGHRSWRHWKPGIAILLFGLPGAAFAQERQTHATAQGNCALALANSPVQGNVSILCGTNPEDVIEIREALLRLEQRGRASGEKMDRLEAAILQIYALLMQPSIAQSFTKLSEISDRAAAAVDNVAPAGRLVEALEEFVNSQLFDIRLLHPAVQRTVVRAREAQHRARNNASVAEGYAARARKAATQALTGVPGTLNVSEEGKTYRGEPPFGRNDAVGIAYLPDGTRYEGSFLGDFTMTGYGIQYSRIGMELAGKFVGAVADRVGSLLSFDGLRYEGEFLPSGKGQAGVGVTPSGGRYEGEVSGPFDGTGVIRRNGIGVEWAANGSLLNAGRFVDDRLAEPMAKAAARR